MADAPSKNPGPFDVKTIEYLAGLMSKHDISEIDLKDGVQRISLRRGARVTMPAALPAHAAAPASGPAQAAPPAQPAKKLIDIKSPTIGTFYAKEKPEAQPYVNLGSRVTPTSVVGLIEAMKLFSEITAGCSGVIVEILVDNAQPVEHNQVLFRVDPTK